MPKNDLEYFGEFCERLQMMFDFDVNQHLFYAMASGDTRPLMKALENTGLDRRRRNGDSFSEIMMSSSWTADGRLMGDGIRGVWSGEGDAVVRTRDQTAAGPMLHGDRRRLELAYSLMMTLPGTPVVRYGDEIGMGMICVCRSAIARALRCSGRPSPTRFYAHAKPIMPVITDGAYGFRQVNVAAQRRDPDSFLNWMERLIRMRKKVPEIGWGDFSFVRLRTPGVLAMEYEWRNNSVLCLHNLMPEPREIRFRLRDKCAGETDQPISLLSDDHSRADENGRHCIVLGPYGYRWFRVGGLDYLLRRSRNIGPRWRTSSLKH